MNVAETRLFAPSSQLGPFERWHLDWLSWLFEMMPFFKDDVDFDEPEQTLLWARADLVGEVPLSARDLS